MHLLEPSIVDQIAIGHYPDPFAVLGLHYSPDLGKLTARTFQPEAASVEVIHAKTGKVEAKLERIHDSGLFAGVFERRKKPFPYRLRIAWGVNLVDMDDPYRFGSTFGEQDIHFLGEGAHYRAYDRMGAHLMEIDGVSGVRFAVWAPNAHRVSVVGDFNNWDGRRHVMRLHSGIGVWELFIPGLCEGDLYKYEVKSRHGEILPLKADPYAFYAERPPKTASAVANIDQFEWDDGEWMARRAERNAADAPISIYEIHLGSWRRVPEEDNRFLTYRELADRLIPYVKAMGFTHVQLMPITEHPFDGSWGYQPISLFAPTSRFGSPAEFKRFVEACHQAEIGVIVDWVPGHFPTDAHGLGYFDGTHLYEHADPRQGFHPDWNTLIYNFGRNEVANYLLANALFWLERYHVDGLRVDAVASMLYLDYSRNEGEWVPNRQGGNTNLEAVVFLQRMNELVAEYAPGAVTIAEESTAWPGVTRPSEEEGLGFTYKWNMGWMHDTLGYMSRDPIYRRYHHHDMTFGLVYAFSERFVLPLSHDEVVHGKGSLIGRMTGDEWNQFANLRAYLTFMWTHPGKKLLFMGGEFGQKREWNHDASLDWHLLDRAFNSGLQKLVGDLNALYREAPALHQRDCEQAGFEWIQADSADESIYAFARYDANRDSLILTLFNFTPVVREGFRFGAPRAGRYIERINSDRAEYGGSNRITPIPRETDPVSWNGHDQSLVVDVGPLSAIVFEWEPA